MRVIVPSGAALGEDALRRLVALMLNMEHAAVVYGPDLAQLPPPHAPWPLVELRPVTRKGLASFAHYSPTVGVVFYTAGAAFSAESFVRRVAAMLGKHSLDHLKRYRAVAATPSTVMRHKNRVSDETVIVGPRKCYKKATHEHGPLPARLLLWTPPSEVNPPPHFSIRAAFTWVFMPVTALLAPKPTMSAMSAAHANMLIASVLYDVGHLSTLPEDKDIYHLSLKDFKIRPLPEFLARPEQILSVSPVMLSGLQIQTNSGALVVQHGGALSYVGFHASLRANPRPYGHLPLLPWDPETFITFAETGAADTAKRFQCCACDVPVAGDAIVLLAPRSPTGANRHQTWYYCPLPPGTLLTPARQADKGYLLCLMCWNSLESPDCLTSHMGARLLRTTVPYTQEQACAQCPGFEAMALLLGGKLRTTGVPGLFIVNVRGEEIALAAENLGPLPMLTIPEVAALNLPVLANLRLAEAAPPRPQRGTPSP